MKQEQLASIYGLKQVRAKLLLPYVNKALELAECNTLQRQACFIAQVGHESGNLRYTREIWGPTPQQQRYEPVTSLSKRLGNTHPGDGAKFMGRGWIQVTGGYGYSEQFRVLRNLIKNVEVPNFYNYPEKLEMLEWACVSAAGFWVTRKLNRFCDSYDFNELTRRINGGYNGLAHRQALYAKARLVLPL